jgi:hypothetical protein
MPKECRPAFLVLPELEQEWFTDPKRAQARFRALIKQHERAQQPLTATVYRCGLVQLLHGYNTSAITGLNMDEATLKKEAGA